MTASLTPSAFGQTVASSGSSTSAYQFGATSGYRSEGDAGLTLVGCRFYDAQVGRFITRDTYLDQKPYAYCDGDPVNATDPDGHDPTKPPKKPAKPVYNHIVVKITYTTPFGSGSDNEDVWTPPGPRPPGITRTGSNPVNINKQKGIVHVSIKGKIETWQ